MKIIVDAMGGDNAPQAPVMGAIQANKAYGVDITLVGRGEDILRCLNRLSSAVYIIFCRLVAARRGIKKKQ